jgi:hypothetical protein
VGGKIFDVANDMTESVDDFLQKLAEVSRTGGGYEYIKPTNCEFLLLSSYVPWLIGHLQCMRKHSRPRLWFARTLLVHYLVGSQGRQDSSMD